MIARRRRGQPLAVLAGIMALWVAARAFGPVERALEVPLPLPPTVAGRVEPPTAAADAPIAVTIPLPQPVAPLTVAPGPAFAEAPLPPVSPVYLAAPPGAGRTLAVSPTPEPLPPRRDEPPEPYRAATPPTQLPFGAVPPEVRSRRRWSADAWVLLREKTAPGAALVGSGTYGGSQAGAVLRYRLAPNWSLDPRAYLRVTTTLSGEDEKEAAAGIALRPLRSLPLDLMVEGRVLRFNGDPKLRPSETRVRPAAMVVLGPPPLPLPMEARAELYAQGGYVGGEGATAFVDGQVRAVREAGQFAAGRYKLEAGIGAWGGAQKGVERADVGPTLALRFPVGDKVFARAGLDWRQRVLGDAEPGSGPVLTLSAGF